MESTAPASGIACQPLIDYRLDLIDRLLFGVVLRSERLEIVRQTQQRLDSMLAELDTPQPGRCMNGLEVAVTCGFGATPADIPAPIRQALLLLVAHWYEHRDPGEIGTPEARIPDVVSHLLSNYLPVRL